MRELQIKGRYRHFKGTEYIVDNIAKDSETLKEVVIYHPINRDDLLWVRDKTMFLSEVDHQKYPEVAQKYRFELIEK